GMPLAIVTAEDNKSQQCNEVSDKTEAYWKRMQEWGEVTPKVNPNDIVFFGVRDTEPPEDYLLEHHGIRNYPVAEVRYRGLDTCVQEALEQLKACDLIYLSFDVDSMDADLVSHGTGTPVSLGFTPEEAFEILRGIIQSDKVRCFEMVEVNPTLDEHRNRMAETAFEILDRTTELIQSKL
ncbi:MAG: arginase, partial [Leptolyngbya sp. SIO3F4]|nr:arginase [Leptolyngbya sp. SIO3F4]